MENVALVGCHVLEAYTSHVLTVNRSREQIQREPRWLNALEAVD